jgi:hypothetical protein
VNHVGPVLTVGFIMLIAASFLTSVANQTTGQVSTPSAADIPYHQTSTGGICQSDGWSDINPQAGSTFDSVNGIQSSDWTGRTLTSIGFYLCAVTTGVDSCPITDANLITVGVFNVADGSLASSFGTVTLTTIASHDCSNNTVGTGGLTETTFTGSFTVLSTQFVGASFSSATTTHFASIHSAQNFKTGVLKHGGILDCAVAFVPHCESSNPPTGSCSGCALAGDLSLGGWPGNNVTASPGLVPTSILLPLFIPIVAITFSLTYYRKQGGHTL